MSNKVKRIISAAVGLLVVIIGLFNGLFTNGFLLDLLCAAGVFAATAAILYALLGVGEKVFVFFFTPGKMIAAVPLAIVIWVTMSSANPTWLADTNFFGKLEIAAAFWLCGVLFAGLISKIFRITIPISFGMARRASRRADRAADALSGAIEKSLRGDDTADDAYRRRQQDLNMQRIHEWDAMDAAKKGDARGAYTSAKKAEQYWHK